MNALLESATGLRLEHPWVLVLLLSWPMALWLRHGRPRAALDFAPARFAHALPWSWRASTRFLPGALQSLGFLLAVIALARPVHREPLPVVAEGIDLFLCLDVSSSMAARDLDAARSRLEIAVAAADEFVTRRSDDRIGLICFARYADLVCPPTLDHVALGELLRGTKLVEADSDEDLTGIGAAVARAGAALRGSTSRSKVVVLLTDGEENVAAPDADDEIAPLHAAQSCVEWGVRVYTVLAGIGRPGADGSFEALDVSQVRRLAERTQGAFFEARDATALSRVYRTIDELEKGELPKPRFRIVERFLPFLVAALSSWWLGRLLRETVWEVLP